MDKAVILARGLGTRMRAQDAAAGLDADQDAVAATGIKALMPIDRPFLDYVLGALAEAGYRRICLVIGPEHDAVRRYFGEELATERLQIDFAIQATPEGTAAALVLKALSGCVIPFGSLVEHWISANRAGEVAAAQASAQSPADWLAGVALYAGPAVPETAESVEKTACCTVRI